MRIFCLDDNQSHKFQLFLRLALIIGLCLAAVEPDPMLNIPVGVPNPAFAEKLNGAGFAGVLFPPSWKALVELGFGAVPPKANTSDC